MVCVTFSFFFYSRTALGEKIEKRSQIKHKKERIGPWTWVLPMILCLISCGFGVFANLHPKLEFSLEPKGKFGQIIDKVTNRCGRMGWCQAASNYFFDIYFNFFFCRLSFYDADMGNVKEDTGFIYDLVADFILMSIYIGMKNEFFFAIPRRKTMVTYSVPGVSDYGPNIAGQII